jgi:hypothetical protein
VQMSGSQGRRFLSIRGPLALVIAQDLIQGSYLAAVGRLLSSEAKTKTHEITVRRARLRPCAIISIQMAALGCPF